MYPFLEQSVIKNIWIIWDILSENDKSHENTFDPLMFLSDSLLWSGEKNLLYLTETFLVQQTQWLFI